MQCRINIVIVVLMSFFIVSCNKLSNGKKNPIVNKAVTSDSIYMGDRYLNLPKKFEIKSILGKYTLIDRKSLSDYFIKESDGLLTESAWSYKDIYIGEKTCEVHKFSGSAIYRIVDIRIDQEDTVSLKKYKSYTCSRAFNLFPNESYYNAVLLVNDGQLVIEMLYTDKIIIESDNVFFLYKKVETTEESNQK